MKSYNGFTGAQRNAAQQWLRTMWGSGRLERPKQCCACGQAEGVIHAHTEDYSLPYAAGKTDEFPLCFTCHMMVHARFRNPERWNYYRAKVREGFRFAMSRSWPGFAASCLGPEPPEPEACGDPPERAPLDEIAARST